MLCRLEEKENLVLYKLAGHLKTPLVRDPYEHFLMNAKYWPIPMEVFMKCDQLMQNFSNQKKRTVDKIGMELKNEKNPLLYFLGTNSLQNPCRAEEAFRSKNQKRKNRALFSLLPQKHVLLPHFHLCKDTTQNVQIHTRINMAAIAMVFPSFVWSVKYICCNCCLKRKSRPYNYSLKNK